MSVEPPSSGRPTGPPSGPLSGAPPPSEPPSQPPAGGGPGAPEPHQPWWRSAPRIALLTTAVVVAVIVAVVLSNAGGGRPSEVFLQAANSTGPDPFTESTAKSSSVTPIARSGSATAAPANQLHSVSGGDPGLYGGTRNVASCDVEKQVRALQASPAKNRAFASVVGIQPSEVPAFLRSLTPVQLRVDTRVTNHGYRNGAATSYQAVLQAGTAVLVDGRGVPRVRCACGNPLTPPVAQPTAPVPKGDHWASYQPSNVVVVRPATQMVKTFVIFDSHDDKWFQRNRGDHTGREDRWTSPPTHPVDPWATPYTPPPTNRPSPTRTGPSSPSTSSPGSESPSPESPNPTSPSSESPKSESPSSESPKSESPSSESPSSESPSSESPSPESPSSESPTSESTPTYESPPTEGGTVTESLAPEPPAVPETPQVPELTPNAPEQDTGNAPAPQDTGGQQS